MKNNIIQNIKQKFKSLCTLSAKGKDRLTGIFVLLIISFVIAFFWRNHYVNRHRIKYTIVSAARGDTIIVNLNYVHFGIKDDFPYLSFDQWSFGVGDTMCASITKRKKSSEITTHYACCVPGDVLDTTVAYTFIGGSPDPTFKEVDSAGWVDYRKQNPEILTFTPSKSVRYTAGYIIAVQHQKKLDVLWYNITD